MATGDLLTLATLALAILVATPLLGGYIHRVMEGQRTFLSPVLRPVERAVYRDLRHRRDGRAGLEGLHDLRPGHGLRRHRRRLRDPPSPGRPAAEPGRECGPVARPRLQHVRQLRDEHELAELLGRDGRQLPHPGGGPRRAQLHLRGDRPGRRHRPHPRPHPPEREDARQLLGRPDPRESSTSCCRSRSSAPCVLVWQGVPQTLERPAGRDHAPGRPADDRPRPDRLPGVDQGAGQQRRRLPQRQLGAPLREPHAADELAGDVRDPRSAPSA